MVFVFYAFLCAGLVLLVIDMGGASTASLRVAERRHLLGLAFAAGPGLAPLLAFGVNPGEALYLIAFLSYGLGSLDVGSPFVSRWTRRVGYALFLGVGFLPSWSLIFLAPFIGLAGVGLVEARVTYLPA